MDRQLRARVLVAETETLGISLHDLIAAADAARRAAAVTVPTLSGYLDVIRPTFKKGHVPDLQHLLAARRGVPR